MVASLNLKFEEDSEKDLRASIHEALNPSHLTKEERIEESWARLRAMREVGI